MLFVIAVALGVGRRQRRVDPLASSCRRSSPRSPPTSILQGIACGCGRNPDGPINSDFIDFLLYSCRVHADRVHRHRRHRRDLRHLAVPHAPAVWRHAPLGSTRQSAARRGVRVGYLFVRAFFISAFAAAIGGLFLAAQVGIGDPNVGLSFTLTSIAAAVLGGASLLGGRGSFVGAVVGALFLNVIINILPFLGWSASYGRIMVGVLTLVALSFYQAPELLLRAEDVDRQRPPVAGRARPRSPTRPERTRDDMDPLERLWHSGRSAT